MSEHAQDDASESSRLTYRSPEVERIGSIADITAASGGSGTDSVYGYPEDQQPPNFSL